MPNDPEFTFVDPEYTFALQPAAQEVEPSQKSLSGFLQSFGDSFLPNSQSQENSFIPSSQTLNNVWNGAVNGMQKRALGVDQAVADALPNAIVPQGYKDYLSQIAGQLEKERPSGMSGAIGGMIGDPLTYISPGFSSEGTALSTLGNALKGGAWGAGSGLTSPIGANDSRAVNTIIQGGIGGAIPIGAEALSYVGSKSAHPMNAVNQIKNMIFGSTTAPEAAAAAQRYVVKNLALDNVTPETLAQNATSAQNRGLGETLAEYTGSPALLKTQGAIAKSIGPGATFLRDYADQRAANVIPDTLGSFASPIEQKRAAAGEIYSSVINTPVAQDAINIIQNDPILAKTQANVLRKPIYQKQLQDIPSDSVGFYHLVRQDLDDQIANTKKPNKLRLLDDSRNTLTQTLYNASPEFQTADTLYRNGAVGRNILQAVSKNTDGNIGGLYNKLYGSPLVRQSLQDSLTPQEYQGMQSLMRGLKNVERSNLSSGTIPTSSLSSLEESTGSKAIETGAHPATMMDSLFNWYQNKVRSKDYEGIAKLLTDPDIGALGEALKNYKKGSPPAQQLLEGFALRTLPKYTSNSLSQAQGAQ